MEVFRILPSFLKANTDAAKRNVEIERYFIIDESKMYDQSTEYSSDLRDIVQRLVNELDDESVNCRIYFCPTKNYLLETNSEIAFAIIRNTDKTSFMYLKSNLENKEAPNVEMNFSDTNKDDVYKQLHKKLKIYRSKSGDKKLTVDQLASKLDIIKQS